MELNFNEVPKLSGICVGQSKKPYTGNDIPIHDSQLVSKYYEYIYSSEYHFLNTLEHALRLQWFFKSHNIEFVPIPYENEHSPLYFIAVCRKK